MFDKLFLNEMPLNEIIRVIKADELDVDSPDWSSCLILAIQKEHQSLFSLILQKYLEGKAKIDLDAPIQNGLNFLSLAIMFDHFDCFEKLLLLGASPVAPVGRNIAKMNQKLRSVSASCDSLNMTPLSIAVDLGRLEMVEKLRKEVDKKELIRQALRIVLAKDKEVIRACLLKDCQEELKALFNQKVKENDFKGVLNLLHLRVLKNIDFKDENGDTPLILAIQNKAYETFVVLKEARDEGLVSFNENLVSNQTSVLNEAIMSNQTKFIKKLLFMGADPLLDLGEISSESGDVKIKKTPLYNLTLKSLQNKEAYAETLFYISCVLPEVSIASEAVKIAKFLGTQRVYKLLLKNSSDLSNMPAYEERMIQAVRDGNVDFVSFLTRRRVSPIDEVLGTTALMEAVKLGKTDVLKVFIEELSTRKLDLPFKGVTPLLSAIWHKQEKAALLLLDVGVPLPDYFLTGESVLKRVVDFDMPLLLKEIVLKKNKSKNLEQLQEALWQAVSLKRNKIVKMFCDLNMDLSYKNKFGTNLLLLAVKKRNFEAVRLLLENKMNVNCFDSEKFSPLHYAILNKDEKMIFFLIEKGAFVNSQNIYGQTPLMLAAQKGMKRVAAVLIEHRADGLIQDKNGKTALNYYKERKEKIMKFISKEPIKTRE